MQLGAEEQGIAALGYVVSYRALQAALDAALARAGVDVRHGVDGDARVGGTPAYAAVELDGADGEPCSRVWPRSPTARAPRSPASTRRRHDYGQVALDRASSGAPTPHAGVAFERFTPEGPIALLPEGDHYGLVWTVDAGARARAARPWTMRRSSRSSRGISGRETGGFTRVAERRAFPLALEFARDPARRALRRARATRRKRCIRSPARASTSDCATRGSWRRSSLDTPRETTRRSRDARALFARPPHRPDGAASRSRTASSTLFGNDRPLRALAARVGAHSARRVPRGEARVHARDAFRSALVARCAHREPARVCAAHPRNVPLRSARHAAKKSRRIVAHRAFRNGYNSLPSAAFSRPISDPTSVHIGPLRHCEQSRRRADGGRHRPAVPPAVQTAGRGLRGVGDGRFESAAVGHGKVAAAHRPSRRGGADRGADRGRRPGA